MCSPEGRFNKPIFLDSKSRPFKRNELADYVVELLRENGVTDIHESDALDYATVLHVQAGDDAFG